MTYFNTILQGDCTQILPLIPDSSVDFVLTDPPYVNNYIAKDGRRVRNDGFHWIKPAFQQLHRVLKRDAFCVCFYGWRSIDEFVAAFRASGLRIAGHLAFPKRHISNNNGYLAYQHEGAYLLVKGIPATRYDCLPDVIEWKERLPNDLHPTQKPLSVLTPLIEAFSKPGDVVLDPFAGSGSTLAAAWMLGRNWLGMELDAGYHRIATNRLESLQQPD